MSLRLRLALAGASAIMLALGLAALGLAQLFSAHVERRALSEMAAHLDQVIAGLARGVDGVKLARAPADPRFDRPYGGLYWQVEGPWGVRRSRSLWDGALDLPADDLRDGAAHVHLLAGPDGAPVLVLERSVSLPERLGGGALRAAVAMGTGELRAARMAFLADLAPYLALLALALCAAGWVQLTVGLRPLRALGARVAALRSGRAQRMGARWPVEVRPIAAEIDALLSAREAETERARARAADLAHGLRTPLQALMGEADRLRVFGAETHAAAIEQTAAAMRRTVDRELVRARSAARAAAARADVRKVAEGLIAVLRRTPEGACLDWRWEGPGGLEVSVHEADLAEALGALAENAARYARMRVTLSACADAGRILVTITDDGPGVPEHLRHVLLNRHARADESGAAGLGLSIAAEIALAAGGALTLGDADPHGLRATLSLPQAPSV